MIMHGEVDLGQRKPGRPLKSLKQSLKDDLKCFDLWEKYVSTTLSTKLAKQKDIKKSRQAFKIAFK